MKQWIGVVFLVTAITVTVTVATSAVNPHDKREELMEEYAEALGVSCDYCHDEDDETKWTRNKTVARYMQKTFVDKHYVISDGTLKDKKGKTIKKGQKTPLTCAYCHKGKAKFLDRTPPNQSGGGGSGNPARYQQLWPTMQGYTQALGVQCTYCHEGNWVADSGKKRTVRMMRDVYTQQIVDGTGNTFSCNNCHQGKTTFLPTEKDAEDLNHKKKGK